MGEMTDSQSDRPAEPSRLGLALRWLGTLVFVAAVFHFVDVSDVAARMAGLDLGWVLAAVALSVPLHVLMGIRWAFTARRVGAPLGVGRAISEYYLAIFVNQVLPVGIAGPAAAAVRHHDRLRRAGDAPGLGACVRAIVLDRVSGQLALALWMAASGAAWLARGHTWVAPIGFGLAVVWAVAAAVAAFLWRRPGDGWLSRLSRESRRALIAHGALAFHLSISTAIIGCLVGMFYCAGRALGVELDLIAVLQVVPLILGSAALPLGFAGWGVREATAGALYGLLALGAEAGVAVSVTFGLISLVTSAPGLAVLVAPAAGRVVRHRHRARLAYSLGLIAGAAASVVTGHPVWVSVAGLLALAGSVWRGRGAWTPAGGFGAANAITALRVVMTGSLWLVFELYPAHIFIALLLVVFALDGVDGHLARRRRAASTFGENFDKEADAYLVLVLCVLLATSGIVGPWVLVGGLLHYVYELAVALFPARGVVPRSQFGRAVHLILVVSLIVPFLWHAGAEPVAAVGAVLVSVSYAFSFYWTFSAREGADPAA